VKLPRVHRMMKGGKLYKWHRVTRAPLPADIPEDHADFIAAWTAEEGKKPAPKRSAGSILSTWQAFKATSHFRGMSNAYRAALIREHMAAIDGDAPLGGAGEVVEVDETFIGGKTEGHDWRARKTVVMGMIERGGDAILTVVDDQTRGSLIPVLHENVLEGSEIHTDELRAYRGANMAGYTHKTVNHSENEYALPDGTSTNQIESFFNHLKKSIAGTHTSVSRKHLMRYVKEFEYRFNRRMRPQTMLSELLSRFPDLDA
jgi:transposase-like protein